jgi:multisubunit Na+/H+ antiporter MnhC subunit
MLFYTIGVLIFFSIGFYLIIKNNTIPWIIIMYTIHLAIVSLILGWYSYIALFYYLDIEIPNKIKSIFIPSNTKFKNPLSADS